MMGATIPGFAKIRGTSLEVPTINNDNNILNIWRSILGSPFWKTIISMVDCQSHGFFWGPQYNVAPNFSGVPKSEEGHNVDNLPYVDLQQMRDVSKPPRRTDARHSKAHGPCLKAPLTK